MKHGCDYFLIVSIIILKALFLSTLMISKRQVLFKHFLPLKDFTVEILRMCHLTGVRWYKILMYLADDIIHMQNNKRHCKQSLRSVHGLSSMKIHGK